MEGPAQRQAWSRVPLTGNSGLKIFQQVMILSSVIDKNTTKQNIILLHYIIGLNFIIQKTKTKYKYKVFSTFQFTVDYSLKLQSIFQ